MKSRRSFLATLATLAAAPIAFLDLKRAAGGNPPVIGDLGDEAVLPLTETYSSCCQVTHIRWIASVRGSESFAMTGGGLA